VIGQYSLYIEMFASNHLFCLPVVLCADRVGQMTKTYSDIDAVTRLLEEVRARRVKPNKEDPTQRTAAYLDSL